MGELRHVKLLHGANMINPQVLAFLDCKHQAISEVFNEDKGAALMACSLDRELYWIRRLADAQPGHSQNELRNYVLPAHIRTVDVMRSKDDDAIEMLTSVIDRHELADNLTGGVRI